MGGRNKPTKQTGNVRACDVIPERNVYTHTLFTLFVYVYYTEPWTGKILASQKSEKHVPQYTYDTCHT